jgi:hypothetical protein
LFPSHDREGPTPERVTTNKLYHQRKDAEAEAAKKEDYKVEEVTAYRLVKK